MAQPSMIPQSLVKTLVCFYIELVIDTLVIFGFGFFIIIGILTSFSRYYGPSDSDILGLFMFSILLLWLFVWLIFKFIVVLQLRKQKYWAWIAALVISGFNFLSFPYLIFGIINLVGLLDSNTIAWFKTNTKSSSL